MIEADTPTYIGRKTCGCVVAAVVDDPTDPPACRAFTAREVAKMIGRGLAVERVTVQQVRDGILTGCQCPKPARQRKPVQKTFDFRRSDAKAGAP